MVKKLSLILFLMFSLANLTCAQESESVGVISKFGAAGGFSPIWIMPKLTPINEQLKSLGLPEFNNSGMMTYGGSGYIYVMFWNNFRIGGMGFGGKKSVSKVVNGFNNQVDYSIGAGGVTFEYTLPFIHKIAVSVGCVLGGGSVEIDFYKNKTDYSWQNIWQSDENQHKKITNSFYTITPTLNIDIPLNRFIAARIGGGYLVEIDGEWKADNNRSISNIPNDLSANSFYIQAGIFVGFFAF